MRVVRSQCEVEPLVDPHLVFGRIELRLETGVVALLAHALGLLPSGVVLGLCRTPAGLEMDS